jgi:enoyl-CoA hydratase/carnithine racemase
MRPSEWSGDDLVEMLLAPVEPPFAGSIAVIVDPPTVRPDLLAAAAARLVTLPAVVVAGPDCTMDPGLMDLVDVAVTSPEDLEAIVAGVRHAPVAAAAAALLLRAAPRRSTEDGLVAESAVFSTLQAGPEHLAWRERIPRRTRSGDDGPRVAVHRRGSTVEIRLNRPSAANAFDVRMRDELLEALAVVEADPELRAVLRGEGRAFCSGGDLDEFGSAPDPATAHLVRLRRSVGAVLARVSGRVTALVHGTVSGSGAELAAFAGRVVAHPEARFVLPELGLGLVPGAGGTVSLTRRIGRHRTAWMALSGQPVEAPIARSWGLVDEIELF